MEGFGNTRCLSHKGGDAGTLREENLAAPHKPKIPLLLFAVVFWHAEFLLPLEAGMFLGSNKNV